MAFKDKYGPWAIIAGASEGLGEAWSRTLADRGLNLVMVDNQLKKSEKLSMILEQEFSIETLILNIDLSDESAVKAILDRSKTLDCRLLVYNAAYSHVKPFLENTPEDFRKYVYINTNAQLSLVHSFSSRLVHEGKHGGIILMSSLAGLIGMQMVAPYAATKAFACNLAEALYHELKPYNIDVLACIAGATSTPAYLATDPRYGKVKPQIMKPSAVSEEAIGKLGRKARHICGAYNRVNYFILNRLLPRQVASSMANRVMKKMYSDEK